MGNFSNKIRIRITHSTIIYNMYVEKKISINKFGSQTKGGRLSKPEKESLQRE